jgi:succinate dehydrogenase / fumarate reductase, membrane anchor subunit
MADFRTPLARVRGLGSAREGTEHFWRQRLTAIANIPLLLFFVGLIVALNGASYQEVRATLSNPFVTMVMLFVLGSALFHMKLGMQTIIEDYIHAEPLRTALILLNTFFPIVLGVVSAYALLKISFGG